MLNEQVLPHHNEHQYDQINSTPRRQLRNRFDEAKGVSSTATNVATASPDKCFTRNTADAIARHDFSGLDVPIEDEEFNNLNIGRNQSDKDEQQRIF